MLSVGSADWTVSVAGASPCSVKTPPSTGSTGSLVSVPLSRNAATKDRSWRSSNLFSSTWPVSAANWRSKACTRSVSAVIGAEAGLPAFPLRVPVWISGSKKPELPSPP